MSHLPSTSSQVLATVGFSHLLIKTNGWDKTIFSRWLFTPGMLFQSVDKWWGDFGKRTIPHEGLDLCLYEDFAGTYHHLDATTAVPAMFDCKVVNIMDDFLGKTIMMEHWLPDNSGDGILCIYGHAEMTSLLKVNDTLQKGDIVCTVSEPAKTKILPHLHITVAQVSPELSYEHLNWEIIPKSPQVVLMDPMITLNGPYDIRPIEGLINR